MTKRKTDDLDRRPIYGDYDLKLEELGFVAKFDEPKLWDYCLKRFRGFWNDHKRSRSVPQNWSDPDHKGKIGWWFPEKWRRDFGLLTKEAAE